MKTTNPERRTGSREQTPDNVTPASSRSYGNHTNNSHT
jgi:hypothetical protein